MVNGNGTLYVCVPLSTDPFCAIAEPLFRWSLVGVVCALLLFVGAGALLWMARSARAARRQRWLALACLIAGIGALALAQRVWATYPSINRIPLYGGPHTREAYLNRASNVVAPVQIAGWALLAITAILLIAVVVQIRRARRGADVPTSAG